MELIRCPVCKTFFRRDGRVEIDIFNTIKHIGCISVREDIPVKHLGPFHYIKKRYPYFGAYED